MSEIEKTRQAREKGYGCADEIMNSDAAAEKYRQWSAQAREALVQDQLIERRMRAIAREEIEANEERLMHKVMHGEIERGRECDEAGALTPTVEAPAAGDTGLPLATAVAALPESAFDQIHKLLMSLGEMCAGGAGSEINKATGKPYGAVYFDAAHALALAWLGRAHGDTTALARWLAETLNDAWKFGIGTTVVRITNVLAEARKAGLIK